MANLKNLDYEYVPVDLARAQSRGDAYRKLNPQGRVPTLEHNGAFITQSLAICEYLEDLWPNPPTLPRDPIGRARVRALALAIACEIHPVGGGRAQALLGK
ncbi:MAG TPA: glutathione S-transferase N-terminal domain-containing protein, partial [Candidatus Binataceae bacterium]|nr:glutathione S-transferase N-terminal domain-containing protein [Candidatus Binataceae bacterium]